VFTSIRFLAIVFSFQIFINQGFAGFCIKIQPISRLTDNNRILPLYHPRCRKCKNRYCHPRTMDFGGKDFVPPKPTIHTCHLRCYRHNSAGGGVAGAPAAGENACRVRLRRSRPAFFSPSSRSVALKMCAIIPR